MGKHTTQREVQNNGYAKKNQNQIFLTPFITFLILCNHNFPNKAIFTHFMHHNFQTIFGKKGAQIMQVNTSVGICTTKSQKWVTI
jgi:hypothetical protein